MKRNNLKKNEFDIVKLLSGQVVTFIFHGSIAPNPVLGCKFDSGNFSAHVYDALKRMRVKERVTKTQRKT